MLYLSIAAIVIILAIAYKNELKSFFGELKTKKNPSASPVFEFIKNLGRMIASAFKAVAKFIRDSKWVCTITGFIWGFTFGIIFSFLVWLFYDYVFDTPVKEQVCVITNVRNHAGKRYIKFSDGHTINVYDWDLEEWAIIHPGDKVRKLYYRFGKTEYTPEFDDNKDEATK